MHFKISNSLLTSVLLCVAVVCGVAACDSGGGMESEPDPGSEDTEASVEGTVTSDSTGDPISGATVTAYRTDEDEQVGEATTGSDGSYGISFTVSEDNTPNELRIKADADGFLMAVDTVSFDSSLTRNIALTEAVQSEVSGQLTDDETGEGVSNVTVTGTSEGGENQLFETTTNSNGQYNVSLELAEEPDQVTIGVDTEDYEGAEETVQFAEEITLNLALVPEIIDVVIDGTVTSEEDGSAIEDVEVKGFRLDEEVLVADTTTGSGGAYKLLFSVEAPRAPDELRIKVSDAFGHEDQETDVGFSSSITEDFALATAPIEIGTIDELQKIGNEQEYPLDREYKLIQDIDASVVSKFDPIGSTEAPFTGEFDGGGYKIDGLKIENSDENDIGLFSVVDEAVIRNVLLINVEVSGLKVVGGLIGAVERGARVVNSSVTGSINDGSIAGGVVGLNRGELQDCSFEGTVLGRRLLGGLVGQNSGGTISNSEAVGSVETTSSNSKDLGGLVGESTGLVESSKADVDVSGVNNVGGLVGENFDEVRNTYATGKVSASGERIGGLVGVNDDGEIGESYSVGEVSGGTDVGGVVGLNGGTLSNGYWNTTTSNQDQGVGGGDFDGATGLKTSEMQGNSAEENMDGFDFQDTWQTVMGDYPALFWENN